MSAALNGLSIEMVTSLFAQRVEPQAMLVTIVADGVDGGPLRFSSSPDGRTSNGRQGLISREEDFEFFPFEIAFSGAGGSEVVRQTQLVIGNRGGQVSEALESVTGQPTLTLELVRTAAPDKVERAMTNATLISHQEKGPSITGTLAPRRFDTEPACKKSYLSCNTPALF